MELEDIAFALEEATTKIGELSSLSMTIYDALMSKTSAREEYFGALHIFTVETKILFSKAEKLQNQLFEIIQS